ncbi:MAG: 3-hydroxybutyryl-CoA dehydrogenase, partial [Pseudomonadota bacterium]|nr:3-hydroxybutyryl-CoA dehydrogenase [Pseudomonadota bacterium]
MARFLDSGVRRNDGVFAVGANAMTRSAHITLAIIGTGAMGRGIAQIAAQAGCRVLLLDTREGAAAEAKDALGKQWGKLVEKGKLTAEAAAAANARLEIV